MENRFWQGLLWGGIVGTVVGAIILPLTAQQRKPLSKQGIDTVTTAAQGLVKEARRARCRVLKTLD